jgi:hypothetical protein
VVVIDAPEKTTMALSDCDSDATCDYDSDVEVEDVEIPNLKAQLKAELEEITRARTVPVGATVEGTWRRYVEEHGGDLVPLARRWKHTMEHDGAGREGPGFGR